MDKNKEGSGLQYGEREALRTVISVWLDVPEAEAEKKLQELESASATDPELAKHEKKVKAKYQELSGALQKLTIAQRRDVITRGTLAAKRKFEMMAMFAHPAVRASRLIRLACVFFPREKVAQRFVPIISDYYREFAEARTPFERLRARVTCYISFARAMHVDVLLTTLDRLVRLWQLIS